MAKKQMIAHIHYQYNKKGKGVNIDLDVDLSRFERQYVRAQYLLDSQIMTDMVPFMPMQTGTFIDVTRGMSAAIAGNGYVYAAAPPFGRFLYEGKVMVDELTGSAYARKGAKKVLVSQYTGKTASGRKQDLEFSKNAHPHATDHWFDAAKNVYDKDWVDLAKKIAGGGTYER